MKESNILTPSIFLVLELSHLIAFLCFKEILKSSPEVLSLVSLLSNLEAPDLEESIASLTWVTFIVFYHFGKLL